MKQKRDATEMWIQDEPLTAARIRRLRKDFALVCRAFKADGYTHEEIVTAMRESITALVQENQRA